MARGAVAERDNTPTSGRVQFRADLDEDHEIRQATGYMTGEGVTADFRIAGAVRLGRTNRSGAVGQEGANYLETVSIPSG